VDETQVHLEAFELYYSMKPKRSYKRVAELIGVSNTTVDDWGRDFKWQKRVKERDKRIADGVAEKLIDEEIDLKVKLYKAIDKTIDKYIDKLDKQEIVLETAKDLDVLGRLWKELETQVETVNSQPQGVIENINAPIFNLNFNKNKKPEDYDDGSYELEDGDDFEEETAEEELE